MGFQGSTLIIVNTEKDTGGIIHSAITFDGLIIKVFILYIHR